MPLHPLRQALAPVAHQAPGIWRSIENWTFAITKDGRLAKSPYIEPLTDHARKSIRKEDD
jgi:hypothetical protein